MLTVQSPFSLAYETPQHPLNIVIVFAAIGAKVSNVSINC